VNKKPQPHNMTFRSGSFCMLWLFWHAALLVCGSFGTVALMVLWLFESDTCSWTYSSVSMANLYIKYWYLQSYSPLQQLMLRHCSFGQIELPELNWN